MIFSLEQDNIIRNFFWKLLLISGAVFASFFLFLNPGITQAATTFDQSGYRWFNNVDSLQVGSTLAGLNASATAPAQGTAFRLRELLLVGNATATMPWSTVTVVSSNLGTFGKYTSLYA